MKYALVQWNSGNLKTSVLTEDFILDKTMLCDQEKEGMVVFVKPSEDEPIKHEVKAYLGRVKYVSDQKHIIKEQQKLLLAEMSSPTNRKRQRSTSEDLSDHVNNIKRLATTTSKQHEDSNNVDEEDLNKKKESRLPNIIEKLQERITKLEEELASEKVSVKELQRANLALQNDLPSLLRQVLESCLVIQQLQTSSSCTTCSQHQNGVVTMSGEQVSDSNYTVQTSPSKTTCRKEQRNMKPPTSSSEVVTTSKEHTTSITAETGSLMDGDKDTNDNDTKLVIYNSSQHSSIFASEKLKNFINPVKMMRISQIPSYKRTTTTLLSTLFDRSILANSSVTGKSKAGRPALEKETVEQIIGYVKDKFPEVAVKEIKATMAQKCKDTRISIVKQEAHLKIQD